EDRVLVADFAVHGVGEAVLAVVAAIVLATAGKHDDLLGVPHWERLQDELINEGEDGGVRANPPSEGQNGDAGKYRRLQERAERVSEILRYSGHRSLYCAGPKKLLERGEIFYAGWVRTEESRHGVWASHTV